MILEWIDTLSYKTLGVLDGSRIVCIMDIIYKLYTSQSMSRSVIVWIVDRVYPMIVMDSIQYMFT